MNDNSEDWLADASREARLLFMAVHFLTVTTQEEDVSLADVMRAAALSDRELLGAVDELHEIGIAFPVRDENEVLSRISLTDTAVLTTAMGAPGRPSAKHWQGLRDEVIRRFGYQCNYCDRPTRSVVIDHVVPVSRGGSNHVSNLVPACPECNSAKGAKTWAEWVPLMRQRRASMRGARRGES